MTARQFSSALVLALALLHAKPSAAATWFWPDLVFAGPCAGSLQACISQAGDGDSVVIVADEVTNPNRYTLIDEDLTISQSISLSVAAGIDAVLAPDRTIYVGLTADAAHTVRISDLNLRRGAIRVSEPSNVNGGLLEFSRIRLLDLGASTAFAGGCGIEVTVSGQGSKQVTISDSLVQRGSGRPSETFHGICVNQLSGTGSLTTQIQRNRVPGSTLPGMGIFGVQRGPGTFRLSANRLLGDRLNDGILVWAYDVTSTLQMDNNIVSGRVTAPDAYSAILQSAGGNLTALNNTVVHGNYGLALTGLSVSQPANVRVANNLVAFHTAKGMYVQHGTASHSAPNNLVYGNGWNDWTPGPATLTVDPLLEDPAYPRPVNASPALDAGNNAEASSLLFDANGERRLAFGTIDVGALEANGDGATQLTATASNTSFNEVGVTPFPVPLIASDKLVATAHRSTPALPGSAQRLGVYLNGGASVWSVFFQDFTQNVPTGQRFSVLAPFASKTGLVHTTSAANNSANLSRIDSSALNGLSFAIAIPLQQWTGTYHNVPISMAWTNGSGGRWQIRNEDGSAMPVGMNFNVAVAPLLSPNAAQVLSGGQIVRELPLFHRLLDDNACAAPLIGRTDDPLDSNTTLNAQGFSVEYRAPSGLGAPGRWFVVAEANTSVSAPSNPITEGVAVPSFPPNAAFNLIVDGGQAESCRAPRSTTLFSNGFEGS
ncbi:MAG: hypothetical protein BWZ07_00817 [Alphaproteobacteria bacterium ADurb.BinA280]|nr:MAG: hypothetical protein BWZ07_00817 [Alphaproteobacteria bacterium ADurb.BinA280]